MNEVNPTLFLAMVICFLKGHRIFLVSSLIRRQSTLGAFNLIVQDRGEKFYEELALKRGDNSQLLCVLFVCKNSTCNNTIHVIIVQQNSTRKL